VRAKLVAQVRHTHMPIDDLLVARMVMHFHARNCKCMAFPKTLPPVFCMRVEMSRKLRDLFATSQILEGIPPFRTSIVAVYFMVLDWNQGGLGGSKNYFDNVFWPMILVRFVLRGFVLQCYFPASLRNCALERQKNLSYRIDMLGISCWDR
jgi:hypothetical protein